MINGINSNLSQSIAQMGDLLQQINSSKSGLDDKMLRVSVSAKVESAQQEGMGKLIDALA